MTGRELRIRRLVMLRERQHDATVAAVRAAGITMHDSQRTAEVHARMARNAQREQYAALNCEDGEAWLLSSFAYELETLHTTRQLAVCATSQQQLVAARIAEEHARRERRQVERLLHMVQRSAAEDEARKEQQALDEAAQIVRSRSSKSARVMASPS